MLRVECGAVLCPSPRVPPCSARLTLSSGSPPLPPLPAALSGLVGPLEVGYEGGFGRRIALRGTEALLGDRGQVRWRGCRGIGRGSAAGECTLRPTASHRTHPHIDPDLPAQLRCFPVLDLSGSQPAPASGPDPPSFGGGAACSSGLQFRRSSGCHPPGQDPRSRFQSWHTGPWRWCVRRGSAKSTKNRNGSRT